jgi:lipoate-protein ligase A
VRRPTGGRAILHDDELTYSVITPDSHPLAHGGVVESYRRISAGLVSGLSKLGLEVSAEAATKRDGQTRSAACFDITSHYELTVDGRKLVGSAQMRRGGALLQHGSVLLSVSAEPFFALLRLGGEADRIKEAEGFARRVIGLKEALGRDVDREEVGASLKSGFEDALGISLHQEPLTEEEKTVAERIMADKYSSDDWNLRR